MITNHENFGVVLIKEVISGGIIIAKKLPKSDTTAAGPAAGGRQPRGVDLREQNEPRESGCCK